MARNDTANCTVLVGQSVRPPMVVRSPLSSANISDDYDDFYVFSVTRIRLVNN